MWSLKHHRNVRVVSTSHDSIALAWDPPVFDGGTFLQEYEIEMDFVKETMSGKTLIRDVSKYPVIRTSRWCNRMPIAHTGFIIKDLIADRNYENIKVYAVNGVGRSPPSEGFVYGKTLAPVAPDPPIFLELGEVTSTSIHISWRPPLNSGAMAQQKIYYVVSLWRTVVLDNSMSKESSRVRRKVLLSTHSNALEYTITGLLGADTIKHILVHAVNKHGILSKAEEMRTVRL